MTKTPRELALEYAHTAQIFWDGESIDHHIVVSKEMAFLAGYKAGCTNTQSELAVGREVVEFLLEKPKWITVKERLPEYDQLALLWQSELQAQFVGRRVDSGLAFPLYYWECASDFFEAWKEIYYPKLMHQGAVSHWMPLPEPPKE